MTALSKTNPWRYGAFADCVAKLEKAGIQRPAAFDLIQDILDRIEKIEREDARVEAVRKANDQFRQRQTGN
jgi:hypothetical protein